MNQLREDSRKVRGALAVVGPVVLRAVSEALLLALALRAVDFAFGRIERAWRGPAVVRPLLRRVK